MSAQTNDMSADRIRAEMWLEQASMMLALLLLLILCSTADVGVKCACLGGVIA